MAQERIIKWLTEQRVNNNSYFTYREIMYGSKVKGNIHRKVKQLYAYGFLDRKFILASDFNGFTPVYRLKRDKILLQNISLNKDNTVYKDKLKSVKERNHRGQEV